MTARRPSPTGPVTPAEYAMHVAEQMSEATFQAQLDDLGPALGWRCYHTHDSRGSQRGFLDWVAIRRERLIFAELKVQSESKGKVTPDQQHWLRDLHGFAELVRRAAGDPAAPSVEVYVWRPIDITTDTIARILR